MTKAPKSHLDPPKPSTPPPLPPGTTDAAIAEPLVAVDEQPSVTEGLPTIRGRPTTSGPQSPPDEITGTPTTDPAAGVDAAHVAALIAGLTRPKKRLLNAIRKFNFSRVLEILNDEAQVRLLDQTILDIALLMTTLMDPQRLIKPLLTAGANIEVIAQLVQKDLLTLAIEYKRNEMTQYVLYLGADPNNNDGKCLRGALRDGKAMLMLLLRGKIRMCKYEIRIGQLSCTKPHPKAYAND